MSLAGLLNQTIGVKSLSSTNEFGESTWGSATNYKGRFEKKNKRRLDAKGEVVETHGNIVLPKDATVTTEDQIVVGSVNYRPVFINEAVDGEGNLHHYFIEVQIWLA